MIPSLLQLFAWGTGPAVVVADPYPPTVTIRAYPAVSVTIRAYPSATGSMDGSTDGGFWVDPRIETGVYASDVYDIDVYE